MATPPQITLVTEAYNLAEGQSEAAFLRALQAVVGIAQGRQDVDVIVLDPSRDNLTKPILARHFPEFTALAVPGLTYDGQKNRAAQCAPGEFIVFLDGDCAPVRSDWLDEITRPLRGADVHSVGGLTLYERFDVTGKAMTILDFGFLFEPKPGEPMGCYASNNVSFRRATYLELPAPDEGLLRSYCYKHAQNMMRARVPVISNPKAFVLHELPDIGKERWRRGYDHVAALWADPALPLAGELEASHLFAHRIMQENFELAISRMLQAPPELGIQTADHAALAAEIQRLMRFDARGLADALSEGNRTGRHVHTREIHRSLKVGAGPTESLPNN